MIRKPVAIGRLLLALVCILATLPTAAADVLLTLDRSLSMKGNDPSRASINGAKLFAELLSADDRLALTTFAQDSERLLPLARLSDAGARERISALVEQVQMNGIRTDFAAALRTAYQTLSGTSDPASERILVLFSDGQINLGNEDANQAAHATVMNELIPKFQADGIRILGVAFSPEADLAFLRRLADATGGQAFRAEKPGDIYAAFVRLFEQTDQPLTAPIVDGEVKVDANVSELKLLVKRDAGDGPMQLTDPSGMNLHAGDQHEGMEWKSTPDFDRITIRQPEAGAWKVTADNVDKKVYLESDLDLYAKLPVMAGLDETVNIVAKLTYRGAAIDPNLMKNPQFKVTVIDASNAIQQQLELQPDSSNLAGGHRGRLSFTAPGTFQVKVHAEGPDFQRQKTYFITIVGTESPSQLHLQNKVADTAPDTTTTLDAPDPATATQRSAFLILFFGNLVFLALAGVGAWWWRRRRHLESDAFDPDE